MSGLKYWLWLSEKHGLSALRAHQLLEVFSSPERIYFAREEEYTLIAGLSPQVREELKCKDMGRVHTILGVCDRLGVRILTCQDADYPERLRQLPDAPLVLYIKGKLPVFDEEVAIGMVGAREPTAYGRQMASVLGYELARGGAVVVSGIARGLDSAALEGAMKAGGTVVSVLGGGVDVYYPRENRWLYEDVAASGALISEYPPGTENKGFHFPIRNRIISGLCLGVVAVECKRKSGTMITMNLALDQDRDVFAVPGPVTSPLSQGTNLLIQQGAKLVTCGEDILIEYRDRYPLQLGGQPKQEAVQRERLKSVDRRHSSPSKQEQKPEEMASKTVQTDEWEFVSRSQERERFTDDSLAVLRALGTGTRSADELVELTQIPVRRVTTALTMLQVDGAIEEKAGRRFISRIRLEE